MTTPTNEERTPDTCDKHNREDCMECWYTTQPVLPREEWEEEFDREFAGGQLVPMHYPKYNDRVKSFIRENRAALLERIEGKIENLMDIGALAADTTEARMHNSGWENCKHKVRAIINSYKGK